jgi:succinylglutamate desuccinylase
MSLAPDLKYSEISRSVRRIIGKYEGDAKGPVLLFFAGVHGNEPAGIKALQLVLGQLQKIKPSFKGSIYGISGNLKAIRKGSRFIDRDLNRIWYPGFLIEPEARNTVSEYGEKIELLNTILDIMRNHSKQMTYLFDLHTTSSQSIPFISISDTLKNRRITRKIPVPLVLGLEELLDGPMFSFFSELGLSTVLFEGGQHNAYSSLENHIAFIWMILHEIGCIKKRDVPEFHQYEEILKKNSLNESRIFELKYRHLIEEGEQFSMKDGFANFQPVKKGEVVARNQHRFIKAPRQGRIFMPLYQSLGKDGYFLVKEIDPMWLRISGRTRKWRMEHILRLMPGIAREKRKQDAFMVDKEIAKWRVLSFFHLLGYRKVTDNGHYFTVQRRPFDRRFPKTSSVIKNVETYLEKITK